MDFTSQKVILGASAAGGGVSYIFQEFYVASGAQNNNSDSITFRGLAIDTNDDIYLAGDIGSNYYSAWGWSEITRSPDGLLIKTDYEGTIQWHKTMRDLHRINDVDIDSGGVYIAGEWVQTGSYPEIFGGIAKYNKSGVFQWSNYYAAGGSDDARFHAVDTNGDGDYVYTAAFEEDRVRSGSRSYYDTGILFKFKKSNGGFYQQFDPRRTYSHDMLFDIAFDSTGRCAAVGLEDDRGEAPLYMINSSFSDYSFQRGFGLDSSGNGQDARHYGVTVDSTDAIICTGFSELGSVSLHVCKFTSSGGIYQDSSSNNKLGVIINGFTSTSFSQGRSVAVDADDNIYVVGNTKYGSHSYAEEGVIIKFDSTFPINSDPEWVLKVKYTKSGTFTWIHFDDIKVDSNGDLVIAGWSDPDMGSTNTYAQTERRFGVLLRLPADGSVTGSWTVYHNTNSPSSNTSTLSIESLTSYTKTDRSYYDSSTVGQNTYTFPSTTTGNTSFEVGSRTITLSTSQKLG